jgi:hypothetical protein
MNENTITALDLFGVEKTKEKEGECKICGDQFTYEVKRGRTPTMCGSESCLQKYRRLMRKPKPKVIRTIVCNSDNCDTEITQGGKGRTYKWCDECRKKLKAKQNADYREKTFVAVIREQGNCCDCGVALGAKTGRGKLALRCSSCKAKHRNVIARKSAKKQYKTVTRIYECKECKQEKEQTGRGKLRKTCPACISSKTTKKDAKSELAAILKQEPKKPKPKKPSKQEQVAKVESMLKKAEDEYDDVGTSMWGGILESMKED